MAADFALTPPDQPLRPSVDAQAAKADAHRLRTLDRMHRVYGVAAPGVTCGGCCFLIRSGGGDGGFPKCSAFRVTCGPGTDWRIRWQACGKYIARSACSCGYGVRSVTRDPACALHGDRDCPSCGRRMSQRETLEQGACDGCRPEYEPDRKD